MKLSILVIGAGVCLYLILKKDIVNGKKAHTYNKLTRIIAIIFFIPFASLILFILYFMLAFAIGPYL